MFEHDYLMAMLLNFFAAMAKSWQQAHGDKNPLFAAETLETAIGEASDLDSSVLLSLSPESIASVMQVSGTDPQVMEYVSRGLLLVSHYYEKGGNVSVAQLRREQAYALAQAYGFALSDVAPQQIAADAQRMLTNPGKETTE